MSEELNRIVILEKNIKGDLSRCQICEINFTAIQPCMMCQLKIEKEEELGRELTNEEIREIYHGVLG